MTAQEEIRRELTAAIAEAQRVGESPLRADQLAEKLRPLGRKVEEAEGIHEDPKSRVRTALDSAERVLRRDDDGREAARHLQGALRLLEDRPRAPSPFLDD